MKYFWVDWLKFDPFFNFSKSYHSNKMLHQNKMENLFNRSAPKFLKYKISYRFHQKIEVNSFFCQNKCKNFREKGNFVSAHPPILNQHANYNQSIWCMAWFSSFLINQSLERVHWHCWFAANTYLGVVVWS